MIRWKDAYRSLDRCQTLLPAIALARLEMNDSNGVSTSPTTLAHGAVDGTMVVAVGRREW